MFSPSRRVRASIRRTTLLIAISCLTGLVFIETALEFGLYPETPLSSMVTTAPIRNHSQTSSAKEILLEPSSTTLSCRSKVQNDSSATNSSIVYPLYIIVKARAVSSADCFHRRMFTRASWGREARLLGIPIVYAAARVEDEQIQKKIEYEHKIYDDLLQFNYIDTPSSMSVRTADVMHWFVTRGCQLRSSYLLIVDDDVLINIPSVLQMIDKHAFQNDTLYGLDSKDIEPGVSEDHRRHSELFPSPSILYPSPVIDLLVQQLSQIMNNENESISVLDDILISGNITEQLGLQRTPMMGLEDCSYVDLLSRTIISGCASTRRIYVWSKFILSRLGQNTREIDRLIQTTTSYVKSDGDFHRTHNNPRSDQPALSTSTSSSLKIL